MPNLSFENIELSVRGAPARAARPGEDTPFRLLVIGDFSGRTNRRAIESLDARRPVSVDCDNFDAWLARLRPKLILPIGDAGSQEVSFSKLDDFHPDSLFARLPLFTRLQQTRDGLQNPATWREAAAAWSPDALTAPPATPPPAVSAESDADTLRRLLGGGSPPPPPAPAPAGNLDALLRVFIAPHVVAGPDPGQATMVAAVDAAIGEQMRMVLHHPDFQMLEAAWRGLDFLVRNLDTDETLQLCVLDLSKAELATDLEVGDLATSETYRILAGETVHTPGGKPWATVIGLFSFEIGSESDSILLARVAAIAAAAGAPFIAEAAGEPTVSNAPVDSWAVLRTLRNAASVGLVSPRFLLRLPYGADTDPTERFAFEEMPRGPEQEAYLWGNPALVAACLLGSSFRENAWDMSPDDSTELGDLPVHTFKNEHGEADATPCGERWLVDREAEALLRLGLMPLVSIRGRDAVRLVRFQSIAEPSRALAGPWQ